MVARSACEAELVALSHTAHEVLFLRRVLSEIGCGQGVATPLVVDALSAMGLVERDMMTARSKHIDINKLGIRALIDEGVVALKFVRTAWQLAVALTKCLDRGKFEMFRGWLRRSERPSDLPAYVSLAYEEECCSVRTRQSYGV